MVIPWIVFLTLAADNHNQIWLKMLNFQEKSFENQIYSV